MKFSLKTIFLALVGSLILVILILGSFFLWQSQQPISSLTVVGKAEQEVVPDELNISFVIEKKANLQNLDKANQEIDAQTKTILEYLQSQSIKSQNIKTTKNSNTDYSNYNPDKQAGIDNNPKDEIRNITVDFQVKLENYDQNLTQANQLWSELLKKNVTNLNQNNFDISKNKKTEICENLQNIAIKNALEKSQKQLKNLGGSTIIKKQIRGGEGCEGISPLPMYAAKDTMGSGGAGPEIMSGKQKLEAVVELSVDFR